MLTLLCLMLMGGGETMEAACIREVEELHVFFQQWFNGELPDEDAAFARFDSVMAPDVVLVSPGGVALSRAQLIKGLRGGHNGRPGIEISTKNYSFRALGPDLWLVTYEEHQVQGETRTARLSSALFRRHPDAPNRVIWEHIHETWLPGNP